MLYCGFCSLTWRGGKGRRKGGEEEINTGKQRLGRHLITPYNRAATPCVSVDMCVYVKEASHGTQMKAQQQTQASKLSSSVLVSPRRSSPLLSHTPSPFINPSMPSSTFTHTHTPTTQTNTHDLHRPPSLTMPAFPSSSHGSHPTS